MLKQKCLKEFGNKKYTHYFFYYFKIKEQTHNMFTYFNIKAQNVLSLQLFGVYN